MPTQFTAQILLQRPWPLDLEAIAEHVRHRFPQIGEVSTTPGQNNNREAGLLSIDRGNVVVMSIHAPLPEASLSPPLRTLRTWDPDPAIKQHFGHVTVSCGGDLTGLDGAKAYAAAVHFVAAAIVEMSPALGVLWPDSWSISEPEAFVGGALSILDRRTPLTVWASFATIVPRGYDPQSAMGIVSYGLTPFIGHELELAPAPIDGKAAYRQATAVARAILDDGTRLGDGQRLVDPDRTYAMTVRKRDFWLRAETPAYVLVGENAVVDPVTLLPAERSAVA